MVRWIPWSLWKLTNIQVRQPHTVSTATTTAPEQGGCATAKPLSDVAPFQVDPQRGADVQFHWPASLGRGTYWFCATANSGGAPPAMSPTSESFTILTNAAPVVQVTSQSESIQGGGNITITVSNWVTSGGSAPTPLALAKQGSTANPTALSSQPIGSGGSSVGSYTLVATLPSYLTAGSYAIVARGECGRDPLGTSATVCAVSEQSAPFPIAPAPATATSAPISKPTPAISRTPSGGTGDSAWLLGGAALALVLILLLVISVPLARRAKVRDAARRHSTRSATYQREQSQISERPPTRGRDPRW